MPTQETDAAEVLRSYGSSLSGGSSVIRDVEDLDYPKELIRQVLEHCLKATEDQENRESLTTAYLSLAFFQDLSTEEKNALKSFESQSKPESTSDDELVELAEQISSSSDTYARLIGKVEAEQTQLASGLQAMEAEDQ